MSISITDAQHISISITDAQHISISITDAQHISISITDAQHISISITDAQHISISITDALGILLFSTLSHWFHSQESHLQQWFGNDSRKLQSHEWKWKSFPNPLMGAHKMVIHNHGKLLSGVPDFFDRNKILSGYDLSHYQVPHCIRVFFYFFDLCLFITIFNFILNYVPIVTFWILTYHKIWILLIIFCFIWSYWIIYFLTCLEVFWSVVS